MEKSDVGFGIVGAGMIAGIHAMAIDAIAGASLRGVYSRGRTKSAAFATKYGCTAFQTLEEMLSRPDIDIVCICTPSGMHHDLVIKSIEAGKHCLIEKPLEVTLEKCNHIINAAADAGVIAAVVFPSRFYENSRLLKNSIADKKFGDLVIGSAYVKWNRTPEYYKSSPWRGTWELDGGGALMNQGIHSVDLLQWYMGPVESVHAYAANAKHKGIEVEDTVVATLKFANGALGTIECSTAVFPGSLKRIEIMGTGGTAILEESSFLKWEFLQMTDEDKQMINPVPPGSVVQGGASNPADISYFGHQRQIEDLIHSIASGSTPFIDAFEGRKSVEIVLAIYESARTGQSIRLPL
ncbi:MAG: Gfo/Idh/MocA family oxidoreductase [Chitinophagaceae bacterium]